MNNIDFQNTLNLLLLGQSIFRDRGHMLRNHNNPARSPVDQILSCSINCPQAMALGITYPHSIALQFLQLNDGQAPLKR